MTLEKYTGRLSSVDHSTFPVSSVITSTSCKLANFTRGSDSMNASGSGTELGVTLRFPKRMLDNQHQLSQPARPGQTKDLKRSV